MTRLTGKLRWLAAAFMLLSTLLVAMACVAVVFDLVSPLIWGESYSGDLAKIPYYADKSWTQQFIRDEEAIGSGKVRYAPFTVWKRPEYSSSTVNVDARGRRVVPSASQDPAALRIYFFGGSAMWGTSSPDWATIPNQVVELSKGRSPRAIHAVNCAESAWVSTQNVIALAQALQHGERPHIVVVYEGANDLMMGLTNADAYQHTEYPRIKKMFDAQGRGRGSVEVRWPSLQQVARSLLPNTFFRIDRSRQYALVPYDWSEEQLEELAQQVAGVYRTNQDLVRAWGRRYGFEPHFYWQPHLHYDRKPHSEAERAMHNPEMQWPRIFLRFLRLVEPKIAEGQPEDFRDLSQVFADQQQQIYTDPVHVTPEGSRLVAAAIVDDLEQHSPAFRSDSASANAGEDRK